MIGSTVGKYRIIEQLGRGGMGTVYKAIDETLDREVAIKALNADLLTDEAMQRFRGEAVMLAKLSHPRIASIYELTRQDKDLLMVMEYVKGETCEKLMARTGAMPVGKAVVLCDQILDALEHAHASGIVHRDLKPGNVMVTASGDVKVMDFGIARVAGSAHLTMDGYMMGTPAYMAPEQVRGEEVDRRMDLYSAAVVLYRLLTGRLPFEADSAISLIHSQLSDPPTPVRQFRPDLPDWVETILMRGLAKGPADRFQTAAEFRLALERGLAGTLTKMVRPVALGDAGETMAPTPTPTALRRVSSLATATSPAAPVPIPPMPTPAPTPTATNRTEATVTLRTPQLALAGGLLTLLVIGVGFLAYAALRRPVIITPAPVVAVPPATPVGVDAGQAPAATSSATSTPASSPEPAVRQQAQVLRMHRRLMQRLSPRPRWRRQSHRQHTASTSYGWKVPAVTFPFDDASANASTPASTSGKGNTKSTTPQAGTASARGSAPAPIPATPLPIPAAAPVPAPAAPVAPALPTHSPQSFGDVRTLVADGDKTKEIDALLGLENDKVVVRNRDNGAVLQSTTYQAITAATYAHTKSPRWQDGENMAPVPKTFGGSGFFLKSAKHWLTLQSKNDFVILRLEDKNFRTVLASIETRTGTKVKRIDND